MAVSTGFALLKWLVPYFQPQAEQALWYGAALSFCEAGIAGGLADWFAVTALFRHPLGVPIPHTNLLVEKRHSIQNNIGGMIRQLLDPSNIRESLDRINISQLLDDLLHREDFRAMFRVEAGRIYGAIAASFASQGSRESLSKHFGRFLENLDYAGYLESVIEHTPPETQDRIAERLLDSLIDLFDNNTAALARGIRERIHQHRGLGIINRLLAFLTGKEIEQNLLPFLRLELIRIRREPQHPIRLALMTALRNYAVALREDEGARRDFNAWIVEFLREFQLSERIYDSLLDWLKVLGDRKIEVLANGLLDLLSGLLREEATRNRLDRAIKDFISAQVNEDVILWLSNVANVGLNKMSDEQFRDFIEDRVKEDLQYIRLNGAVVGGFAGMMLYFIKLLPF